MVLSHEDFEKLKSEILKDCDERYVLTNYCNEKQEKINKKFANDDKRLELMLAEQKQMRSETKKELKFNNWLTGTILGIIVAAAAAVIRLNFGG